VDSPLGDKICEQRLMIAQFAWQTTAKSSPKAAIARQIARSWLAGVS